MRKSTTRHHLNKTQRHNEWLKLYAGGATLQSIADLYGVSKQAVFNVCKRALQDARTEREELDGLLIELLNHRYSDLFRRAVEALDDVSPGREVGRAALLAAARGILDSHVKLLGLDQPQRHQVVVESQLDRDLRTLTTIMQGQLGAPPTADADG